MSLPPRDLRSTVTLRHLALAVPAVVASFVACAAGQAAPAPVSALGAAPSPVAPSAAPAVAASAALPQPTAQLEPTAVTSAPEAAAVASPTPPPAPAPPALAVSLADEPPFLPGAGVTRAKADASKSPTDGGSAAKRRAHNHHKKGHRPYHPDPGIIVDVSPEAGHVVQADAQRIARASGYWPFRHCYEEGLRRDQKLAGHVSMDLALAADGSVASGRITESSITDESVGLCVLREADHLPPLGASASGDSSGTARTLALRVALAVGDATVPVPKAAPHSDDLRDALRDKWPAAERCYDSGLERRRDLGGRLALKLQIGSSGEVQDAQEYETRFGDADVTRCVAGVYRGAKLTHLKHAIDIVYALHFEAKPADAASGAPAQASTEDAAAATRP